METKEAIEILNEMKDSPFKWQSCNNAIDHVIVKVNELEKQLAQANYDLGMTQINLESQTRLLEQCTMALTRSNDALVESVPKSEITDAVQTLKDLADGYEQTDQESKVLAVTRCYSLIERLLK
jgi:hypothetical protein